MIVRAVVVLALARVEAPLIVLKLLLVLIYVALFRVCLRVFVVLYAKPCASRSPMHSLTSEVPCRLTHMLMIGPRYYQCYYEANFY